MATLRSELFTGDSQILRALNIDASHIKMGAKGDHVAKIQAALAMVDSAQIGAVESSTKMFGSTTAAAVLSYKKKRSIINKSYQSQADNIVGKMTVAALDNEVYEIEQRNKRPGRLLPVVPPGSQERGLPMRTFVASRVGQAAGTPTRNITGNHFGPSGMINIPRGSIGKFLVSDGVGQYVFNANPDIVDLITDFGIPITEPIPVTGNPQFIGFRGKMWGSATIELRGTLAPTVPKSPPLLISVEGDQPLIFVPTHAHHHSPCGKWDEMVASPTVTWSSPSSVYLYTYCRANKPPPGELVRLAVDMDFKDKPTARMHLDWYIYLGQGNDYNEDSNLETCIRRSPHVRRVIRDDLVSKNPDKKLQRVAGNVKIEQQNYDNDDDAYSFGAIDFLSYEADYANNSIRLWFKDNYEWHPVYKNYYTRFDDDEERPTNMLHIALVEMKLQGARDFWMVGVCRVNLDLITNT